MLLNIQPKEMGDKMRPKRANYPTFQSILTHCREKLEMQREIMKAEALHKSPKTEKVHAMVDDRAGTRLQQPASSARSSGAIATSSGQLTNPITTVAELNNMVLAMQNQRTQRRRNEDPKKNAFKKFIFRGCWECGEQGHNRQDCPKWKKIVDSTGKAPQGHQGAKDKAWAKWKSEKAASKGKDLVNMLHDVDTEDEDDSEYGDFNFTQVEKGTSWADAQCMGGEILAPLIVRPPMVTNAFDVLKDSSADCGPTIDDQTLQLMNSFAHRVHVGKKKLQAPRRPKEDIDALMKEFGCTSRTLKKQHVVVNSAADVKKIIRPLPDDGREIDRLATLCPSPEEEPLQPGQRWVLFDTGASCSAVKVSRDCPEYIDQLKPTKSSLNGHGAETAGGGCLIERGEVTLDMVVDGANYQLPARDMDVSMPIASGKSCVGAGDDFAVIHQNGGTIRNRVTGKEIQLYGRHGVFFFKATILPPGSVRPNTDLPFARRG